MTACQMMFVSEFGNVQQIAANIGKTGCGRATVDTLKLNNALAITVCQNWIQDGWHPPKML
jgi:dissimilatory sulfite reductase (desulfoviridin) alpha/beta subunit